MSNIKILIAAINIISKKICFIYININETITLNKIKFARPGTGVQTYEFEEIKILRLCTIKDYFLAIKSLFSLFRIYFIILSKSFSLSAVMNYSWFQ